MTVRPTFGFWQLLKAWGVAAVAIVAIGCVPIPPSGEKPFADETASIFTIGETSRDEVISHFAAQPAAPLPRSFGSGTALVYHATGSDWGFLMCGFGAQLAGCDYATGDKHYYLVLQFDDAEILSSLAVESRHRGCADSGFCRQSNGSIMVLADATSGPNRVKSGADQDVCTVYTPVSTWSESSLPVTIWIDGAWIGDLTHSKAYFIVSLTPGRHEIKSALTNTMVKSHEDTVKFECRAGESVYLHTDYEIAFWTGRESFNIKVLAAPEGERMLTDKDLALLPEAAMPQLSQAGPEGN